MDADVKHLSVHIYLVTSVYLGEPATTVVLAIVLK